MASTTAARAEQTAQRRGAISMALLYGACVPRTILLIKVNCTNSDSMLRLQALLLLLPCASAFAPTVLPLVNSDRHSVALRRPDGVRGLALQLKTQTDP